MSREHPIDVTLLGADFEPLHCGAALCSLCASQRLAPWALGDVDEEDSFEQQRPGVALGLFRLATEEVRLLRASVPHAVRRRNHRAEARDEVERLKNDRVGPRVPRTWGAGNHRRLGELAQLRCLLRRLVDLR